MPTALRSAVLTLLLAVLVTLAGCAFPVFPSGDSEPSGTPAPSAPTPSDNPTYADPDTDTIGWEDGYWHNESIAVDQSDGLTDAELDAYVARGMARVEYLRNAEFNESVEVQVLSREEYQQNSPFDSGGSRDYSRWNNQVWEALFITSGSQNVSDEFTAVTDSAVLGYYSPSSDELVIVTDSPDTPVINNGTLIHELTHALQDQRFDITQPEFNPQTQDEQLASNGLIEGEANYIQERYAEACVTGNWDCVTMPAGSGSASPGGNTGVQLVMYQPYNDGPRYIEHLVQTGGWEAVDAKFEQPPTKSREIIHPGTTVTEHEFPRLAEPQNGWERYETLGQNGADSVGEASVFVMMWYQNYQHYISTIPRQAAYSNGPSTFNYQHSISDGLVNDHLIPYKNGEQDGYVWRLKWDSAQDAEVFTREYEQMLSGHYGTEESDTLWKLNSGGFEGAYYVHQQNDTVTIAHAPSESALYNLYPAAE